MTTFTKEEEEYVTVLRNNGIIVSDMIKSVKIVEPDLAGAHFASCCETVEISFKDKDTPTINLFAKKLNRNPGFADLTKELKLFTKESSFFKSFVKDAKAFCVERVGSSCPIDDVFPKFFHGTGEIIVLENLTTQNYIMLSKDDCQDLHTAKMVLEKLASMHGVSYAMIKSMGTDSFRTKYSDVVEEAFTKDGFKNLMSPMYDNALQTVIQILEEYPSPGSKEASATLKSYVGTVFQKVIGTLASRNADEEKMLVLNHGDFWNNNMMFHKNHGTGELDNVLLFDLQAPRIASITMDICHFLFTSVKSHVRRANFSLLMKTYFNKFLSIVSILKESVEFSYEEFLADFNKRVAYGYFMALTWNSTPGSLAKMDFEKMSSDIGGLVQEMNGIITSWVQKNPEEAAKISTEIVVGLKEYLGFVNNDNIKNLDDENAY